MFGKFMDGKKLPTKEGKYTPVETTGSKEVKVFELELANMEEKPSYSLTHQLTVGSEIGNIVLDNPSISPRHATFMLDQDVVSIIDHGSVGGTLVNDKPIPSGKKIILEEADEIKIGELVLKIKTHMEEIPYSGVLNDSVLLDQHPEEDEIPSLPEDVPQREVPKSNPPKLAALPEAPDHRAANALVRVLAVGLDLLLSLSLLIVFLPFDEFRSALDFLPAALNDLAGNEVAAMWADLTGDYPAVQEIIKDGVNYLTSLVDVGHLLIMFALLRLGSTLLFGVSICELLLGVAPTGNALWARAGGALRVVIGLITGPLIIPDLPALVSRRTLKEFMTFTKIRVRSKLYTILASIVLIPLMVSACLLAPLFEGLEPPLPVQISDVIDKRVKLDAPIATDTIQKSVHSKFFGMGLAYSPSEVTVMPMARFENIGRKSKFNPEVVFYHRDLMRPVKLELMKTFDLRQLLGHGIKGNFFLYDKYPSIHSFVYPVEGVPLKTIHDARTESLFANEVMQFTKMSLSLDLSNALEVMETQTPLLSQLMSFKAALFSLLEYKDFTSIGFVKLGNVIFMRVSYDRQRPFDLIIPLRQGPGQIFKIDFDKKENLSTLSSRFYKYTLDRTDWLNESVPTALEDVDAFRAIDLLSKRQVIPDLEAQNFYGYFFEQSAEILKRADAEELAHWKRAVDNIVLILRSLPMEKLNQNMNDVKDALETKNLEYFNVSETTTI